MVRLLSQLLLRLGLVGQPVHLLVQVVARHRQLERHAFSLHLGMGLFEAVGHLVLGVRLRGLQQEAVVFDMHSTPVNLFGPAHAWRLRGVHDVAAELVGLVEGVLVHCAVYILVDLVYNLPIEKDQAWLLKLGVGGPQQVLRPNVESVVVEEGMLVPVEGMSHVPLALAVELKTRLALGFGLAEDGVFAQLVVFVPVLVVALVTSRDIIAAVVLLYWRTPVAVHGPLEFVVNWDAGWRGRRAYIESGLSNESLARVSLVGTLFFISPLDRDIELFDFVFGQNVIVFGLKLVVKISVNKVFLSDLNQRVELLVDLLLQFLSSVVGAFLVVDQTQRNLVQLGLSFLLHVWSDGGLWDLRFDCLVLHSVLALVQRTVFLQVLVHEVLTSMDFVFEADGLLSELLLLVLVVLLVVDAVFVVLLYDSHHKGN